MKVKREIASVPVRSAGETWAAIVALISGADTPDAATLKAAASIMESLIAERLLDGSGWLPEPLRLNGVASEPAEQQGEAGPLPEFLSHDEEQETAPDEDRPQQLAAAE